MRIPSTALLPLLIAGSAQADEPFVPSDIQEVISLAAPARGPKPEMQIKLRDFNIQTMDFTFPSGLRVLFQHDPSVPVVAVTAVTDHGASDDPVGKEGLAHLVEHLWFRSEHGGMPKTWDLLESEMGCSLNAFTQYDITAYMTVCGSEHLASLLRLESLRILDPIAAVTEDMVRTEIEVVRNEIRMRAENFNMPFFTVWEYVNKHMYPESHPYHRPMAGDHTSIRNIRLPDVQAYTDAYYKADTTTIMVVGDLGRGEAWHMLSLLAQNLDPSLFHPEAGPEHIARQPRPGVRKPDPNNPDHWVYIPLDPTTGEVINIATEIVPRAARITTKDAIPPASTKLGVFEGPVEKPTVVVAWTLPPAYRGNDTLYTVTGNIISNMVGQGLARLNDPSIKEFGGCGALPSKHGTTLLCYALAKSVDSDADRIATKIIDQLSNIFTQPGMETVDPRTILSASLGFARNQLLAQVLNSVDLYAAVGGGRATDTAQHAHFTGSGAYFAEKMEEIPRLTPGDVFNLLETYVQRDRAARVFIKPLKRDEVSLLSEDTAGAGGHYRGGDAESILNPSIDPSVLTPEALYSLFNLPDFGKLTDVTLQNGLRVVTMPHADSPLVRVALVTPSIAATDPDGLYRFAQRFSTTRIADDPLRVGGNWADGGGSDWDSLGVQTSSLNLDAALWLVRERLEAATSDLNGKGSWLKSQRKRILGQLGKMDWHMTDMRNQHLNPGHPLTARFDLNALEALKKAGSNEVMDVINRQWHPSNATLVIVGDIDAKRSMELANRYFGGWRKGDAPPADPIPEVPGPNPAQERKIYVFDSKGRTQTDVTLVCPLVAATTEPSAPHQILGDVARMTLFAKLREEAGVVYSPQAATFVQPGGSAFMFMTAAIQNDSAVFGMERYLEFLQMAEERKLNDNDIRIKQLSRARGFAISQQSIEQMLGKLLQPVLKGEDWGFYDRYAQALSNTDQDAIAAIVDGCAEHAFITFKGPKDKVTAQLEEGGYDFELVDWKQRGYDLHAEWDPKDFAKADKKRKKAEAKKAKQKAKDGDQSEDDDTSDDSDED